MVSFDTYGDTTSLDSASSDCTNASSFFHMLRDSPEIIANILFAYNLRVCLNPCQEVFLINNPFSLFGMLKQEHCKNQLTPKHHKKKTKKVPCYSFLQNNLTTMNVPPRVHYVGLRNLGATCYMNCYLQTLFMNPDFRYRIFSLQDSSLSELKNTNVLYELKKLFYSLQLGATNVADPSGIARELHISTENQGDATEFATLLLMTLEKHLGGKTSDRNFIPELFRGYQTQRMTCKSCGKMSVKTEDFYELRVQLIPNITNDSQEETKQLFSRGANDVALNKCTSYIPSRSMKKSKRTRTLRTPDSSTKNHKIVSLEDALTHALRCETLRDDNRYMCDGCQRKVNAERQVFLTSLPPYLHICFERYAYQLDSRQKLTTLVDYPLTLNLNKYCCRLDSAHVVPDKNSNTTVPFQDTDQHEYELIAILEHQGSSALTGHYVAYIRDEGTVFQNVNQSRVVVPSQQDSQQSKTEIKPLRAGNDQRMDVMFLKENELLCKKKKNQKSSGDQLKQASIKRYKVEDAKNLIEKSHILKPVLCLNETHSPVKCTPPCPPEPLTPVLPTPPQLDQNGNVRNEKKKKKKTTVCFKPLINSPFEEQDSFCEKKKRSFSKLPDVDKKVCHDNQILTSSKSPKIAFPNNQNEYASSSTWSRKDCSYSQVDPFYHAAACYFLSQYFQRLPFHVQPLSPYSWCERPTNFPATPLQPTPPSMASSLPTMSSYTGLPFQAGSLYTGTSLQARSSYTGMPFQAGSLYTGMPRQAGPSYTGTPLQARSSYTGLPFQAGPSYTGTPLQARSSYTGLPFQAGSLYTGMPLETGSSYTGMSCQPESPYTAACAPFRMYYKATPLRTQSPFIGRPFVRQAAVQQHTKHVCAAERVQVSPMPNASFAETTSKSYDATMQSTPHYAGNLPHVCVQVNDVNAQPEASSSDHTLVQTYRDDATHLIPGFYSQSHQKDPIQSSPSIREDSNQSTLSIREDPNQSTLSIREDPNQSTLSIREDPNQSTLSIREDPIEPTLSIREDSIEPTLSIREDPNQSTLSIREDPNQSTLSIREDPSQSTLSIREDPNQPTLSIREDSIEPTLSIREDPNQSTLSIREDPSQSTLSIREDPNQPTLSIREDPNQPTLSIREDPIEPTLSIREDPNQSTLSIQSGVSIPLGVCKSQVPENNERSTCECLMTAMETDVETNVTLFKPEEKKIVKERVALVKETQSTLAALDLKAIEEAKKSVISTTLQVSKVDERQTSEQLSVETKSSVKNTCILDSKSGDDLRSDEKCSTHIKKWHAVSNKVKHDELGSVNDEGDPKQEEAAEKANVSLRKWSWIRFDDATVSEWKIENYLYYGRQEDITNTNTEALDKSKARLCSQSAYLILYKTKHAIPTALVTQKLYNSANASSKPVQVQETHCFEEGVEVQRTSKEYTHVQERIRIFQEKCTTLKKKKYTVTNEWPLLKCCLNLMVFIPMRWWTHFLKEIQALKCASPLCGKDGLRAKRHDYQMQRFDNKATQEQESLSSETPFMCSTVEYDEILCPHSALLMQPHSTRLCRWPETVKKDKQEVSQETQASQWFGIDPLAIWNGTAKLISKDIVQDVFETYQLKANLPFIEFSKVVCLKCASGVSQLVDYWFEQGTLFHEWMSSLRSQDFVETKNEIKEQLFKGNEASLVDKLGPIKDEDKRPKEEYVWISKECLTRVESLFTIREKHGKHLKRFYTLGDATDDVVRELSRLRRLEKHMQRTVTKDKTDCTETSAVSSDHGIKEHVSFLPDSKKKQTNQVVKEKGVVDSGTLDERNNLCFGIVCCHGFLVPDKKATVRRALVPKTQLERFLYFEQLKADLLDTDFRMALTCISKSRVFVEPILCVSCFKKQNKVKTSSITLEILQNTKQTCHVCEMALESCRQKDFIWKSERMSEKLSLSLLVFRRYCKLYPLKQSKRHPSYCLYPGKHYFLSAQWLTHYMTGYLMAKNEETAIHPPQINGTMLMTTCFHQAQEERCCLMYDPAAYLKTDTTFSFHPKDTPRHPEWDLYCLCYEDDFAKLNALYGSYHVPYLQVTLTMPLDSSDAPAHVDYSYSVLTCRQCVLETWFQEGGKGFFQNIPLQLRVQSSRIPLARQLSRRHVFTVSGHMVVNDLLLKIASALFIPHDSILNETYQVFLKGLVFLFWSICVTRRQLSLRYHKPVIPPYYEATHIQEGDDKNVDTMPHDILFQKINATNSNSSLASGYFSNGTLGCCIRLRLNSTKVLKDFHTKMDSRWFIHVVEHIDT